MKQGDKHPNYTRRRALKTLGSVAGVTVFSGFASAADPEVVRTIDINTAGYARVNEAQVMFYDNGAIEHRMTGHNPHGASAASFAIQLNNASIPDRAEAQLVERTPSGKPDQPGSSAGVSGSKGGGQNDIGTSSHSGGNSDSDYYAYLKLICEKGDRCACWPEWDVYNAQDADWSDDDGDGCVSDSENLWWWKWAINGDACNNWKHNDNQSQIWEDGNPCSLDQVREDRFSYENDGGWNSIVMRQQLTLHADGSNDWEVLRYDDGGNGCLLHKVETG